MIQNAVPMLLPDTLPLPAELWYTVLPATLKVVGPVAPLTMSLAILISFPHAHGSSLVTSLAFRVIDQGITAAPLTSGNKAALFLRTLTSSATPNASGHRRSNFSNSFFASSSPNPVQAEVKFKMEYSSCLRFPRSNSRSMTELG